MKTFQQYLATSTSSDSSKKVIIYELRAYGHVALGNELSEVWNLSVGSRVKTKVHSYEHHVAHPPTDRRLFLQKLRQYDHTDLAKRLAETWDLMPRVFCTDRSQLAEKKPTKRMPKINYSGPASPYRIGTTTLEEYHRSAQQAIRERDEEIKRLKAEIRRLERRAQMEGDTGTAGDI